MSQSKCFCATSVNKLHRAIIYFFLIIFFTQKVTGQNYALYHFDVDNGLASNTVYEITQDEQGYIWLGTYNGLCRYDGVSFKNYRSENMLRNMSE